MDLKQAVEEIKSIIESVAGEDCDKAAVVAAAALNTLYVSDGVIFRVQIGDSIFGISHEKK